MKLHCFPEIILDEEKQQRGRKTNKCKAFSFIISISIYWCYMCLAPFFL